MVDGQPINHAQTATVEMAIPDFSHRLSEIRQNDSLRYQNTQKYPRKQAAISKLYITINMLSVLAGLVGFELAVHL